MYKQNNYKNGRTWMAYYPPIVINLDKNQFIFSLDKFEALKKYWGYDSFRPLQEVIIDAIADDNDTLALLPTGGGKSICFQVPAMIKEGICIVVSPLIALMQDQVAGLRKRKISAQAIYSGMSPREIDIALDNCIYGDVKFLYVSPERLETDIFKARFEQMTPSFIAVDEAHCISQWGYDFRPSYHNINLLREIHPGISIIALTATATPEVQKDICDKLELKHPSIFKKSFARPNLSYSVFRVEDKEPKLLQILRNVKGSGIVYCQTRKETQSVSAFLKKNNVSADYYHAGLDSVERHHKQEAWLSNITRIIVATSAFGMGIDKPNVRVVVNYGPSASVEAYYQEAGRAGRDEKKAYGVLLYDEYDLDLLKNKIDRKFPEITFIKKVYESLGNYLSLAVGSIGKSSYDFDIDEFCHLFKLPPFETFNALKILDQEEFIALNESFSNPSKLRIAVSNATLYEFQLKSQVLERFIKNLLRTYGGELYSSYLFISEKTLAKINEMSLEQCLKTLDYLKQNGIVDYIPLNEHPQIAFRVPRQSSAKLSLNKERLLKLKETSEKQIAAISKYARDNEHCRTKQLCAYFGDTVNEDCLVCDNCLKKAKTTYTTEREILTKHLKQINFTTVDQLKKAEIIKEDILGFLLDDMLRQELITNENGRITLL